MLLSHFISRTASWHDYRVLFYCIHFWWFREYSIYVNEWGAEVMPENMSHWVISDWALLLHWWDRRQSEDFSFWSIYTRNGRPHAPGRLPSAFCSAFVYYHFIYFLSYRHQSYARAIINALPSPVIGPIRGDAGASTLIKRILRMQGAYDKKYRWWSAVLIRMMLQHGFSSLPRHLSISYEIYFSHAMGFKGRASSPPARSYRVSTARGELAPLVHRAGLIPI